MPSTSPPGSACLGSELPIEVDRGGSHQHDRLRRADAHRTRPVRDAGHTAVDDRTAAGHQLHRVRARLRRARVARARSRKQRAPSVPANAARAFFLNGGQRLYVSRVFAPTGPQNAPDWGVATRTIAVGGGTATWTARWPGAFGNVFVQTLIVRTKKSRSSIPPTPAGVPRRRARSRARLSRSSRHHPRTPRHCRSSTRYRPRGISGSSRCSRTASSSSGREADWPEPFRRAQ